MDKMGRWEVVVIFAQIIIFPRNFNWKVFVHMDNIKGRKASNNSTITSEKYLMKKIMSYLKILLKWCFKQFFMAYKRKLFN